MNKYLAVCIIATTLTGCDSNKNTADTQSANGGESHSQASAVSAASKDKTSVSLGNTAIDLQAALGRLAPVINTIAPCPFLSDETARTAAKTNYELERRQVSNTECRWSYNAGFSVSVTVKPIEQSIPIEQRRYNLDVDTLVESQSGPGANASLVSDTAWGKPLPFGYGFELDGNAVFVRVTGMQTDGERLRVVADAIAQSLPMAPAIEPQWRTESVAFEPCSVWQDQAVQDALGPVTYSPISSHSSGKSCSYKAYGDESGKAITLTVRFGELDIKYHAKEIERGHEDVTGFDFPVSTAIEPSDFGTYSKIVAYVDGGAIEVFILDEAGTAHKDLVKQLLKNLASRISL